MADDSHLGATPDQLDDRLALATAMINDQLFNADLSPLTDADAAVLRDPAGYAAFVEVTALTARVDLSHALVLLHEWHAWNTRR